MYQAALFLPLLPPQLIPKGTRGQLTELIDLELLLPQLYLIALRENEPSQDVKDAQLNYFGLWGIKLENKLVGK